MTKNYVFTTNDVKWIKNQTNKNSNNLVDILDDEKKVVDLNKDYHYRQSVLPRLEHLKKKMLHQRYVNSEFTPDVRRDIELIISIIKPLKNNPRHRLSGDEMRKCNELWRKYKNV